jgi:DNA-directed RNA polymerase specialized sigma24 family protein
VCGTANCRPQRPIRVNSRHDAIKSRCPAERLGITEGTVKIHLHSIFEQLGVRSRIELMIALAAREHDEAR